MLNLPEEKEEEEEERGSTVVSIGTRPFVLTR